MSIIDDLAKAHAEHDPHDFKSQGANSPKGHVNAPYSFEQFPQVVYKDKDTRTVASADELEKALADGWSETPGTPEAPPAAPDVPPDASPAPPAA